MNEKTLFILMRLEEALRDLNEDLGNPPGSSDLSKAISRAFECSPTPQLLLQLTVPMHRFIAKVADTVINEQIKNLR